MTTTKPHKSHVWRISDASSYDHICVNCGATDVAGGGWGRLAEPCPNVKAPERRDVPAASTSDRLSRALNDLEEAAINGSSLRGDDLKRLRATVRKLSQNWNSIDTAPNQGIVRLLVQSGGERKVFAAEAAFEDGNKYWVITTGWTGWTRIHPALVPIGWKPLAVESERD